MSAYRPYSKYKPSGVEWLGDVPEGWVVTKLKFTAAITPSNIDKKSYEDELPISLCNYTDVYYNETITSEIEFMAATATRDQIRKFSLKQYDVIITKDSEDPNDIAVPSLVAETMDSVVCGYHLTLLRPTKNTDGRFLKRYFDSKTTRSYFSTRANGLTRYGLGSYPLSNADIALPPLPEQHQIASFLDRECGKLDALQAKQERLIELLKEKRQALISHAVTKGLPGVASAKTGLDPTLPAEASAKAGAKLKPSGIEWLGEVPEHWEITRLKFVASIQTGVAKGKDNAGRATVAVPYLRVANVQDGYLALDDVATMEIPVEDLPRYSLRPGDVLMNEGGDFDKLGRGHVWRGEIAPCIHQNHVFAIRPILVSCEWLSALTSSNYAQFYFMSRSKQSTNLASLSSTNLMELPLLRPPLAEQRAIVAHLDEKCGKIDQLKAKAERGIELLKERRSALISAAVTGKIDVRKGKDP